MHHDENKTNEESLKQCEDDLEFAFVVGNSTEESYEEYLETSLE